MWSQFWVPKTVPILGTENGPHPCYECFCNINDHGDKLRFSFWGPDLVSVLVSCCCRKNYISVARTTFCAASVLPPRLREARKSKSGVAVLSHCNDITCAPYD